MSLFGSNDKSTSAPQKIRPTVIRTQNVAKDIIDLARSNHVDPSSLDFNLLDVETYTRVSKESQEVDWEEVDEDKLHEIDDATAILNPHFEIKQMYEIEVFTKDTKGDIFQDFDAAIGANATKCKVYLSIKSGSKLSVTEKFEEQFLRYINKSKIRAGILINIFDEMVEEVIKKASAIAKVDGELHYEQNETLLIANAYEPSPTINDDLIMHYDKNSDEVSENEKIDYSKRGFIKSVLEDDLLIEYIKPKKGKAGRNCRGEFMNPLEPEVTHQINFSFDDSIEEIDNKENIEYRAKSSGYIALDGTTYSIKSDMDVGAVTFKKTGSINAGTDSDVVLNIKESDPEKDAIGKGMEVEVKEVDVVGNVGPGAKVDAKRASIDGQVHQSAEIRANEINITVHKGLAIGEHVSITRLETGVVRANSVQIEQATGGDIHAKEIDIGRCASHVKATASQLIEIHELHGTENIFTIDPLIQKDNQKGLDENQEEIEELTVSLRDISNEISKYETLVKRNTTAFNDLKRRLVHYKKNGIKIPSSFLTKFKQFQGIVQHLEGIKQEYKVKEDKLQLLTTQTSSFQENIFDARIINRGSWVGHNELVFKLVDPPIQLSYSPPEGYPDLIFAIVEVEEGEYEIQAVHE